MRQHPHILQSLRRELVHWRRWSARALVIGYAALTGLAIVCFTRATEWALDLFSTERLLHGWMPWVWTPLSAAAIVWLTRRFAPGAAGSGIPQVMAALESEVPREQRGLYVSLRLAVAKMLLTTWGLLAGLSLGREGPSVQVGASIMHNVRHWLPRRNVVSDESLMVAGGAAGIAAAFNTPLAGVMFAIEELSRNPEQRRSGLIITAIVLSGVIAVSMNGNASYFGLIQAEDFSVALLLPGLIVALASGAAGGLFSRLLASSLVGTGLDPMSRLRRARPVVFAGLCGLLVVVLGEVGSGGAFGSGYSHTRNLLTNGGHDPAVYVLFKSLATWLTTWSGVPAGIFAPSLSIGGALGHDIALAMHYPHAATLMALGMAGFLAAVTQAPLTSFIIVMEMVDNHGMVLSLMACALLASLTSRLISRPLYSVLAEHQLSRLPKKVATLSTDSPPPEDASTQH